jgi:hypothetical protein
VVLQHKGGNLAPWNLANYKIHADGNRVYVDEQSLIFYHFHGFKPIRSWLYNLGLADYGVKRSAVVLRHIYQPYIRELLDVTEQVSSLGQVIPKSSLKGQTTRSPLPKSIPLLRYGVSKVKGMRRLFGRILSGSYICVVNGHII